MKVLNLYCGIGGNRKLWKDVEVTAVEQRADIAKVYQKYFPEDIVIIGDAHKYLLENFREFDFVWSSPPCVSHSHIRRMGVDTGVSEPIYPDLSLYQEIILLRQFCKTKWVVENTSPYYIPLYQPTGIVGRHRFWANFPITDKKLPRHKPIKAVTGKDEIYGFTLVGEDIDKRKDQTLKNLVNPEIGSHIFNLAFKDQQKTFERLRGEKE